MRLGYLFTSFEGRISRKPFWIANIAMAAILMAVILTVFVVMETKGAPVTDLLANRAGLIGLIVLLYPSAALMVKRLHDRDRPGILAALFLGPSLLVGITDALGVTGAETWNTLDYLLNGLTLIAALWVIYELGLRRGTPGPNRYGPDPLAEGRGISPT
jgi:uncharacterized membrane protein YhaH (DUF805 family)